MELFDLESIIREAFYDDKITILTGSDRTFFMKLGFTTIDTRNARCRIIHLYQVDFDLFVELFYGITGFNRKDAIVTFKEPVKDISPWGEPLVKKITDKIFIVSHLVVNEFVADILIENPLEALFRGLYLNSFETFDINMPTIKDEDIKKENIAILKLPLMVKWHESPELILDTLWAYMRKKYKKDIIVIGFHRPYNPYSDEEYYISPIVNQNKKIATYALEKYSDNNTLSRLLWKKILKT